MDRSAAARWRATSTRRNMDAARQLDDGRVQWVEVCYCETPLAEEREYWEPYFTLEKVQDAHARSRCRDLNGSDPWACSDCDCTARLEASSRRQRPSLPTVAALSSDPAPEPAFVYTRRVQSSLQALLTRAGASLDRGRGAEAVQMLAPSLRSSLTRDDELTVRSMLAEAGLLQDDLDQAASALGRPPDTLPRHRSAAPALHARGGCTAASPRPAAISRARSRCTAAH